MKAGWQTKRLGEICRSNETEIRSIGLQREFDYVDGISVSRQIVSIGQTQR